MDVRLVFPSFQIAPKEYSQGYLNNLVNMLNVAFTAIRSPGEGRQSTIVITNMPSNGYNLEPGTLFEMNGVVYIAQLNRAYVQGVSATGRVGTVTVTIV
jgi:hypothetical protein